MESIDEEVKKVLDTSTGSAKLNLPKVPSTYSSLFLQPKRVMSAYTVFIGETVPILKKQIEGSKTTEVMKLAAEKWKGLDEDSKKPFIERHMKDIERYTKEVEAIIRDGYFMTEDGKKSCDVAVKKKKRSTEAPEKPPKTRTIAVQTMETCFLTKRKKATTTSDAPAKLAKKQPTKAASVKANKQKGVSNTQQQEANQTPIVVPVPAVPSK